VARAVAVLREWLADDRLTPTDASRASLLDRSVRAQAQAALQANPLTRPRAIGVTVAGGLVELTGRVDNDNERKAAEAVVARIPGVTTVRNTLMVFAGTVEAFSHGQFRHGEERSWGGYGGGGYEAERQGGERKEDGRKP